MTIFLVLLSVIIVFAAYFLWQKNIYIWLPAYLVQQIRGRPKINENEPVHIVFCIVDHFEPRWNNATYEQEVKRVDTWISRYPEIASKHKDSDGRHPQYTFFYPEEEYRKEHLDKLAKLCKAGFGDVEIHLHHDNDTADGLRTKLNNYKQVLRKHGLLSTDEKGTITYGFIHGNWALDNSRRDGRWCGVNNELQVLKETGCYADFTFPSAPSDTQTRKSNSIYYATDDPQNPKSHDTGVGVEAGRPASGDLMIIQGPLALNWKNRKWGILPRIENGEITVSNPPTKERIDLWVRQHIHVKGEPNRIFIKVHTHGCQERNMKVLLDKSLNDIFVHLEAKYNDGIKFRLHYMTAKEMYSEIKSIESKTFISH